MSAELSAAHVLKMSVGLRAAYILYMSAELSAARVLKMSFGLRAAHILEMSAEMSGAHVLVSALMLCFHFGYRLYHLFRNAQKFQLFASEIA